VGRDPVTHEPVRRGKLLEQVNGDVERALRLQQQVGGVDSGRSGADNGDSKRGHRADSFVKCARHADRDTRFSANTVKARFTGPCGSGLSAATPPAAQRRASSTTRCVTAWSRNSAM